MKAANKGAKAPAELPEGRASTKGNSQDQSTYRTQGRGSVSQAVERIRQAATRKPQEKLTALLHHITTDALRCAFYDLKKTASAGVDGMVWTRYEDGLKERLLDLHGRVHSGAYRALPSRRVEMPKPDGGTRPLGIAALEDKIVQKAVVDDILTPLYEPEFLGFSYGFRPGRGAHDALDALAFGIERRKVSASISASRVGTSAGVRAAASTAGSRSRHARLNQLSSTVLPLPRGPVSATLWGGEAPRSRSARQRVNTVSSARAP